MKNVSDTSCREIRKTHFMFSNFFFENRTVYEIMWKNVLQPDMSQVTKWRMPIACWIPKTTDTHSQCVILIAFPLQQWLHVRASLLRYTYILCIVMKSVRCVYVTLVGGKAQVREQTEDLLGTLLKNGLTFGSWLLCLDVRPGLSRWRKYLVRRRLRIECREKCLGKRKRKKAEFGENCVGKGVIICK